MIRLKVDSDDPDAALVDRGAAVIRSAGIIALPTDTLYGLAADPFNPVAVRRIFEVKSREQGRALPLVAADADQIARWLAPLSPTVERLAARFWPGPLTLLVPAPSALAADVAGGTGRVGVRVPAHAVARALCRAAGVVLTATSANISGEPPTEDPERVALSLGDRIELLLDAGPTPGGRPSTIADVSSGEPRLVRAGAIAWDEILACVERR